MKCIVKFCQIMCGFFVPSVLYVRRSEFVILIFSLVVLICLFISLN